jgi:hypothetical protein
MLMDQNMNLSSAQVITGTALSTYTYDILNSAPLLSVGGTYAPSTSSIIGNATYFGEDLGLGRGPGEAVCVVTTGSTSPAGGTGLQIALQGAVDNGGGTIGGLTFVPYIETRSIPLAGLTASTRIATIKLPKREIGQGLPRFINLNYIVSGSNFSGLTVTADFTLGTDDATGTLGQYAANY